VWGRRGSALRLSQVHTLGNRKHRSVADGGARGFYSGRNWCLVLTFCINSTRGRAYFWYFFDKGKGGTSLRAGGERGKGDQRPDRDLWVS